MVEKNPKLPPPVRTYFAGHLSKLGDSDSSSLLATADCISYYVANAYYRECCMFYKLVSYVAKYLNSSIDNLQLHNCSKILFCSCFR